MFPDFFNLLNTVSRCPFTIEIKARARRTTLVEEFYIQMSVELFLFNASSPLHACFYAINPLSLGNILILLFIELVDCTIYGKRGV